MTTAMNPTELLWAYGLKREHKHLLKRIASIESAAKSQEARITAAERASLSIRDTDVAVLAKQVKTLQDGAEKQAKDLEHKVADAVDNVQATSEAICLKVASLEKEGATAKEDEQKKTFQRDKALLKRIGELEIGLQAKDGEIAVLRENVDEIGLGDLKDVVEGLEVVIEQQGDVIKEWRSRLAEAERKLVEQGLAVEAYRQDSARAARETAAQAALQAAREQVQAPSVRAIGPASDVPITQPQETTAPTSTAPKKSIVSHKTKMTKELASLAADTGAVPTNTAPKKPVVSHKSKMTKELASLAADTSSMFSTQNRPVVRRGPGWLEVERAPSKDIPLLAPDQPSSIMVASTRGIQKGKPAARKAQPAARSKKRKIADESVDQPTYTQRTTRSQVPKKPMAAPRPESVLNPASMRANRRQVHDPAQKTFKAANKKQPAAPGNEASQATMKRRRPSTPEIPESPSREIEVAMSDQSTILSSPLSSPSPAQPRQKKQKQVPVVQVAASPPSPPRPQQRRRRIEQDDDYETFLRKCRE